MPRREKIMEEKDDWCAHCKKTKKKQKQRFFAWFALWNKEISVFDSLQRFFTDTLTKQK